MRMMTSGRRRWRRILGSVRVCVFYGNLGCEFYSTSVGEGEVIIMMYKCILLPHTSSPL